MPRSCLEFSRGGIQNLCFLFFFNVLCSNRRTTSSSDSILYLEVNWETWVRYSHAQKRHKQAGGKWCASVALAFVAPKGGSWKRALTGGVVHERNLVTCYRRNHSRRTYKKWGYWVRGIPNYTSNRFSNPVAGLGYQRFAQSVTSELSR